MTSGDFIPMRYVGPMGKRQTPARCEGVGVFYHGDVVKIPLHMVDQMPPDQWLFAWDLCQYERLDGKICGSPKLVPGSKFCEIHHEEVGVIPVRSGEDAEPPKPDGE